MPSRRDPSGVGRIGSRRPTEGERMVLVMLATLRKRELVMLAGGFVSGFPLGADTAIVELVVHFIVIIIVWVAIPVLPFGGTSMAFKGFEALIHALSTYSLGIQIISNT